MRNTASPTSPASSAQEPRTLQSNEGSPSAAPLSRPPEQRPRALPRIGDVELPGQEAEHDGRQAHGVQQREEQQGRALSTGESDIDPATGARRLPQIG